MTQAAAIFDVDRTLLDGMSGAMFISYLWKQGYLPFSAKARIVRVVAGYRLGILPEERIVELGVISYAGLEVEQVRKIAVDCVEQVLRPRFYKEALDAIKKHKEQGDFVVLATGSSNILVEAIADFVGADLGIGTSAPQNNGRSVKRVNSPMCYKQGKLNLIEAEFDKRNISLPDSTLYSDNDIDLPVFLKVAHPCPVNPHVILADEAKKRGWEILSWETPLDPSYKVSGNSWPLKQ